MDDELVLLTSYFNLAGGRRQDTADTFRVDPSVASATSPDGTAALYIVTESSGGSHMGTRARRLALDTVAWEYASHGDVQPAARLRGALQAAHEAVVGEYEGHVSIGMSVIAVEGDTVFLGQVAPAQVYVVHDGGLHSIAAAVEGTSPFGQALGSSAGPQVTVFRDQIGAGDVVALCSSWFHRGADPDDLRRCFGAGDADDIAECLLDLGKEHGVRDTTVIVIEAALARDLDLPSDEEEPIGFMEQVDTAVQALANVGRMFWAELRMRPEVPESNGQTPRDIPDAESGIPSEEAAAPVPGQSADTPHYSDHPAYGDDTTPNAPPSGAAETGLPRESTGQRQRRPGSAVADQATDEVPIVPADEVLHDGRDVSDAGARPIERGSGRKEDTQEVAALQTPSPPVDRAAEYAAPAGHSGQVETRPESPAVSEIDQVNRRIQNTPDLGDVIPPVQAFPDTSTEPSRIYATTRDIQAVNKRRRRFGGVARPVVKDSQAGAPVIRPGMNDVDLRRPVGRPTPHAVIWLGAVAVTVLAAAAVIIFYLHHRSTGVAVKPYATYAARDIVLAQQSKTPTLQDLYLGKARNYIRLAQLHGTSARRVAQLNQSLQSTSDSLHHIARVTSPTLLSDFARFPGAQAAEVAAGPGILFVLDTGRHSVFSLAPSPLAGPNEIVKAGEIDNALTVSNPQQLAVNGSTALVFDDHNVLVRYTAGTKSATSLVQPSQTPEQVVAIGSSAPDVYVLDKANNELWRYPNGLTYFNPPPSAFFTPNTPGTPNLNSAVSFAFDDKYLYVLRSDGSLLKFDILQANPQKFTPPDSVLHTPLRNPTELFTSVGLNYVWVGDPANGRILQLDKSGNYVRTYRSSGGSGMDLHQMKSFTVGPEGHTMYVLAGTRLFSFGVQP